ncbi:DUF6518 family protein [Demequina silvatica]|uniref:DUF6518 family protein n=1 Tax=Demequina silvatica TaxID=1638988 RepID=UPI000783A522|nr:DUF6518 family protein [Demequina silvatica]
MQPVLLSFLRVVFTAWVALILGGLTPVAQGVLPDEVASLANSVAGWTVPTAALVWWLARSRVEAALGGAVAFVALTLGYSVVSDWRGEHFDPTFWATLGLVAGPVIGLAAHALRSTAREAAVGAGVLAGVLIGEAVYGLTVIADTTSPVFWWICAAAGVVLLGAMCVRLARPGVILLACVTTVALAGAFVVAYRMLGTVGT